MPNVGFNLDKFLRRIERQRVAEPGDVELLAELLTEAHARIATLEAALTAALALVEAGRQERERLRADLTAVLSLAQSAVNCINELLYNDGSDTALKRADRSMHGFRKALAQHRAALAPEEPHE